MGRAPMAGVLHGLESVRLDGPWVTLPRAANGRRPHVTRRTLPPERITIARPLDDLRWEPAYDARRETAVAATGWLCGRLTRTEVDRKSTRLNSQSQ